MRTLIFILFLSAANLIAQDNSYFNSTKKTTYNINPEGIQASTVIVPFHADLYISHFDGMLAQKNKTTEREVKNQLTAGFMQALLAADTLVDDKPALVHGDGNQPLTEMYASFNYKLKEIPEDPTIEKSSMDKMKGKWKSLTSSKKENQTEEAPNAPHQLTTKGRDLTNKYLGVEIADKSFMTAMKSIYGANNYIFINQFEIVIPTNTDQLDIQHEQNSKQIKIHFSIVDASGNEVDGGIVEAFVPNHENDIDEIIQTYYPPMAESIMKRYYYFRG
jgi:hypothetical protein